MTKCVKIFEYTMYFILLGLLILYVGLFFSFILMLVVSYLIGSLVTAYGLTYKEKGLTIIGVLSQKLSIIAETVVDLTESIE